MHLLPVHPKVYVIRLQQSMNNKAETHFHHHIIVYTIIRNVAVMSSGHARAGISPLCTFTMLLVWQYAVARKPSCNHANVERVIRSPWQWFQFHNYPLDVAVVDHQRMFPWARPKFACLLWIRLSWCAANVISFVSSLAYITFAHMYAVHDMILHRSSNIHLQGYNNP